MLFPLSTDRPSKRRPVITEGLIVLNLTIYLLGLIGQFAGWLKPDTLANLGHFDPEHFKVWQLVSYQFLHDPSSFLHVAFNMLFLWVFGAPVEDRLGRPGFLAFYLVGGAAAGLGHLLASPAPVIGASGSVAAVTGAFLALFPRSRIKVVLVFFLIGVYVIPSIWFIGFFFVVDFLRQTSALLGHREGNVAYMAHLAGYVYGFTVGFTLLATGLLKHEDFDIFYLFKQARRRAAFRAATRHTAAGPWESAPSDTGRRLARQGPTTLTAAQQEQSALRTEIGRLLEQHDLPAAAARFRSLLRQPDNAVLSEPRLLDVANQLFSEQDWNNAAAAYELLLKHYPTGHRHSEVRLLLALTLTRHLNQPARARELLEQCLPKLPDQDQTALAHQLLEELDAATTR